MSKLIRPRDGKLIAGVCRGLADYFNVNVWVIRIIFLGFFMPGGVPGFLVYFILWMVMPPESVNNATIETGEVIE